MNKQLTPHFQKLENARHAMLGMVNGLPHDKLNKKPAPDQWSPLQVIYHVKEAEKLSLAYMQKKVQDPALSNTSLKEYLRSMLLRVLLALPLKFKAPRVVKENIPDTIKLEELSAEWDEIRSHMQSFLSNLDEQMLTKKIFKHPRIGMINIVQTMHFYLAHLEHHIPQIKRQLDL